MEDTFGSMCMGERKRERERDQGRKKIRRSALPVVRHQEETDEGVRVVSMMEKGPHRARGISRVSRHHCASIPCPLSRLGRELTLHRHLINISIASQLGLGLPEGR